MRIVTVNVNGIRAAARRGGLPWLVEQEADVITLQEVRATPAQAVAELQAGGFGGWHLVHGESAVLGRAGVAVVTRAEPVASRECLDEAHVGVGRWAEATVAAPGGPVTVASVYVPSGEVGTPRQDEKYVFLDAMTARLRRAAREGEALVVTGDLNVAHRAEDLKNAKGNVAKAGFLPRERAYVDTWLEEGLVVDVHRALHGPGPGPYTWWSWRGKAFDNDAGWRIDYQLATPAVAATARAAVVGRAPTYAQRWSDHAPVVVDYAW